MAIETATEASLSVRDLKAGKANRFALKPDADARAALAAELGILKLPKLTFDGTLTARGAQGWRLEGQLGATVVQPCVVTLEPVTTRIDDPVARTFLPEEHLPALGDEAESPEDDSLEALGTHIPLWTVMTEALALALPPYPRKDDAELGDAVYTEPGAEPLKDEDLKPFAGLAALRAKLAGEDDSGGA